MATDYGTDVACVADFSGEFREVSGQRLIAEALARRLITPRGMDLDDPDYGTDLRAHVGLEYTARNAARLVSDAQAECAKDERVEAAVVSVESWTMATRSLALQIDVTTIVGESFRLTVAVSSVNVELLTP